MKILILSAPSSLWALPHSRSGVRVFQYNLRIYQTSELCISKKLSGIITKKNFKKTPTVEM